ncbi:MAG: type III secretion system export apparatus subunit SctU [Puniceicoccales bacterium]|jgi:type III secretion protein U|nr:type III secretion system export apparatus subunit SctU [Puniceicoccales bacterium]
MSEDKTEMPTPKRMRDARNKGNVAKSADVNSTALLIGIFCYIGMGWEKHLKNLCELLLIPSYYVGPHLGDYFRHAMIGVAIKMLTIVMPLVGIVILIGIAANFAQVGILFTMKPIAPDISKINPMAKAKQIFSMKNLFEFGKSSLKILFLGTLIYMLVKGVIDDMLSLPFCGIGGVIDVLGPIMELFAKNVIFAYIVVAIIDYAFQKRNWTKQLMMSKDEIKREYKESEGDGQIKGKRKQLHREMMEEDPPQRTKKASVLVTNPEHMAVALLYDIDRPVFPLPLVLAKGVGKVAEKMIEIARENNVPIMRNVPLAHALMDTAEILEFIPGALIGPVAEVLRWVKNMKDEHAQGIGLEGQA